MTILFKGCSFMKYP